MRLQTTTLIHFISQVGTTIIGFLVTLYLARTVGAGALGVYFVVVALLSWGSIPGSAISTAMKKRISERNGEGQYIVSGAIVSFSIVVLLSSLLLLFRDTFESYVGAPIVFIFIGILASNYLFEHAMGVLNGQKMVAQSGIMQTFDRILRGLLQVALVYLGYSLFGLVAGHALALLIVSFAAYFLYDSSMKLPTRADFRSLLDYARFSWLGNIKARTFVWMDTIILNFFVVSSLIGIYEIAWRIASIFVLINISLTQSVFPEISDISSQTDNDAEIRSLLQEVIKFSGVFVIPGFFGALVIGPEILGIYGSEFTMGSTILLILILARGVESYGHSYLTVLNAVDRPDISFRINAVLVIANVSLNIILIYLYGWYGAAIATLAASCLSLILSYSAVSMLMDGVQTPMSEIFKQIFSGVLMAVIIYLLKFQLSDGIYYTIGIVFVGAAIYLASILYMSSDMRRKFQSLSPVNFSKYM